ncbi:sugar transferase [Nocardia grenadensis]|uniref:sugar transferase n=1 Tax=Nocardia grenadensis TaxID=931537 RepID=UPI000B273E5E|nr:sugar transferase [Nocardia grenadensis]
MTPRAEGHPLPGGSEYWAPVDAAIDELIAIDPVAFAYMKKVKKLRRPEPGERFGADWVSARGVWFESLRKAAAEKIEALEIPDRDFRKMSRRQFATIVSELYSVIVDKVRESDFREEFTEKDFLELGRVVKRAPIYSAFALFAVTGLAVDQLVHNGKVSWRSLFFRQQKLAADGTTVTVWKLRTLPENEPQRSTDREDIKRRASRWANMLRATSMDEMPQLLLILLGRMQYFSGRPLLDDDYAEMRNVLSGEEYAFWAEHMKDDLWSALHFPGCRALSGYEYLRARYLAAFIWSRMGSRTVEKYMMRVVDRYMFATFLRAGTELVLGTGVDTADWVARLLPAGIEARVRDIASPILGPAAGRLGRLVRGSADRVAEFVYPSAGQKPQAGGSGRQHAAEIGREQPAQEGDAAYTPPATEWSEHPDSQSWPRAVRWVARYHRRGDIQLRVTAGSGDVSVGAVAEGLGGRAQQIEGLADAVARLRAHGQAADAESWRRGDRIAAVVFGPVDPGAPAGPVRARLLVRWVHHGERVELRDLDEGRYLPDFVPSEDAECAGMYAVFLDNRGYPVEGGVPDSAGRIAWQREEAHDPPVGCLPGATPLRAWPRIGADSGQPRGDLASEPGGAVRPEEPDDSDEESEFYIAGDAPLRAHPLLANLLPAGEYRIRGGGSGVELPRAQALALREVVTRFGEVFEGAGNRVHVLGEFALREPKRNSTSAATSGLNYRLWPQEHRTVQAITETAIRLGRNDLLPMLPQILYVESAEDDTVLFEIHRSIPGGTVSALSGDPAAMVDELRAVLAEVPITRTLFPLPEQYPESGDSAGFFRMLVEHTEEKYQELRRNPLYRRVFDHLEFPASLTAALAGSESMLIAQRFQLLHGDITTGNVIRRDGGTVVLIDYGLALYGPPDYEVAVALQRNAGTDPDTQLIPTRLRPYVDLLQLQRVMGDTVRLVDLLDSDAPDSGQARTLAAFVQRALPTAAVSWYPDYPARWVARFLSKLSALIGDRFAPPLGGPLPGRTIGSDDSAAGPA